MAQRGRSVEDMVGGGGGASPACLDFSAFWKGKSVFLTGHTGFKGSWLSLWLYALGAKVTGYALAPPTLPSMYQVAGIEGLVTSVLGDVREYGMLHRALSLAEPEIVFHLAAQPLVRDSYLTPVATYSTNVMGTVNLLEAVRQCSSVRAVVNVTSDKCYENKEVDHPFREEEPLGGYDPYSSSKACSELVTSAWRSSFFSPHSYAQHRVAIATARSGNVVGGGDWAKDRLVPDCIRALQAAEPIHIRNPDAKRPWQHVLEPLSGYLLLAQRLCEQGCGYGSSWNFGPFEKDAKPVEWIVNRLCEKWGAGASYSIDAGQHLHEALFLSLDISRAQAQLGWRPRWNLDQALDATLEWVNSLEDGKDIAEYSLAQIECYVTSHGQK